jgi:hypothetical protein
MAERARPPLISEFLFFNRFFGDNGKDADQPASQLRAVRSVRLQGFGLRSCPTWERRLWLTTQDTTFQLRAVSAPTDFAMLRSVGAGVQAGDGIAGEQAREQVRRAVFFLHTFDREDTTFLTVFLRSRMILDFVGWQKQVNDALSTQEARALRRRILHVLQEHFTGVKLPEGMASDRHLFITLSRRSRTIFGRALRSYWHGTLKKNSRYVLSPIRISALPFGESLSWRDRATPGNSHCLWVFRFLTM